MGHALPTSMYYTNLDSRRSKDGVSNNGKPGLRESRWFIEFLLSVAERLPQRRKRNLHSLQIGISPTVYGIGGCYQHSTSRFMNKDVPKVTRCAAPNHIPPSPADWHNEYLMIIYRVEESVARD